MPTEKKQDKKSDSKAGSKSKPAADKNKKPAPKKK